MIAVNYLTKYPIPPVIETTIVIIFESLIERKDFINRRKIRLQGLTLFRTFLDIGDLSLHVNGIEQSLPILLHQYYGFLYSIYGSHSKRPYAIITEFQKSIALICCEFGFPPPTLIRLMSRKVSADIEICLIEFNKLKLNQERVFYYTGWTAKAREGELCFWNLSLFYQQYGAELTEQLWHCAERLCNKNISTTNRGTRSILQSLIKTISQLYQTKDDLKLAGTHSYINKTVCNIFFSQLIDTKQQRYDVKSFYKQWPREVKVIREFFIKSGIWSDAPLPLWNPSFKVSSTNAETHRHRDEQGKAFNHKLVTHIPLSYTDDQTIEALLENIEKDIEHVSCACRHIVDITMTNFANFKQLAATGIIKKYSPKFGPRNKRVDMTRRANQCATWEYYGYNFPMSGYTEFLGLHLKEYKKSVCGKRNAFAYNHALLTPFTLYPFMYLLIEQHPKITEGWFLKFELYDKNGKKSGFKQSGNNWLATSTKLRKGSARAQQPIILNETSKALFDNIVSLTTKARLFLKGKGDDNWRYLFLSGSKNGLTKPYRIKRFISAGSLDFKSSQLRYAIEQPSVTVNAKRATGIRDNLTLTTFRASCGVRVYLNTRSVKAMSEALGHNEYRVRLISRYLPEPILNYFQSRWVRLLQNAITYEAMVDSEYLLDSLDFGEDELDEFLRNHKLKPLPEHLLAGQVSDLIEKDENSPSTNAIIPISVSTLQVMNCLVDLVDMAKESQKLSEVAIDWYETARYVLESINTQCNCPKLEKAMTDAIAHPLSLSTLKGAIYVD